jgi:O-antigen/teichoic acid export membrane protein
MLLALLRQFELPQISYFGDWRLLRQHKGAILFFIAMTTLNTLESQSDTILLSAFAGETEVGWYGAATTVAYSLLMFSQAYRFAVYPLMTRYALETPGRLSQLYTGSMQTLALLVLPMVGGIVVLAPDIVRLVFGPEFAPTAPVLRILILSLLFVFLNEPNVRVLLVSDRQRRLFIFLFASALANVSLNLLLIPAWGTIGAAAARVASSFVLFTLCYWDAARHVLYQHSWRIVARPALATALMLAMVYLLRDQPLGAVIGAGMVVYGLAALLTGAVSRQQMRTAYEYVAHRRGVMPSG